LLTFEPDTQWQIRNSKGALVGQLLGDGVEMSWNGTLDSITICLAQRQDILLQKPDEYTVFDFAYAVMYECLSPHQQQLLNITCQPATQTPMTPHLYRSSFRFNLMRSNNTVLL